MKIDYLLLICVFMGVLLPLASKSKAEVITKNSLAMPVSQLDARSQDKTLLLDNSLLNNSLLKKVQLDNDCQQCHSADMSSHTSTGSTVPAVSVQLAPGQEQACLECHAENDVSRHYIQLDTQFDTKLDTQLAQLSATEDATTEAASASEPLKKASGKGPGMSLTMYYKKSRLGNEPNKMVLVDAGKFTMGSNSRLPDEGPEHQLTLEKFWIDIFEVTNYQYKKFIDATSRRSPQHFENRTFPENKIDHPVVFVSWKDASAYCKWAKKRLPTDQEWEKAARGDDARIYPWGEVYETDLVNSPQRWMELKLEGDTTPVGAFAGGKSPYGLYDMSGNVWEWTESWYVAYPGNTNSSENYGQIYKTLKGGSWWDCSFYKCGISAPTFNRSFFLRSTKNKSFGFRCAKDAG